jgi:hypothetical protein
MNEQINDREILLALLAMSRRDSNIVDYYDPSTLFAPHTGCFILIFHFSLFNHPPTKLTRNGQERPPNRIS